MPKVTFNKKVSGPFFELKGQPLKDAGADMIQDLLKEGQAKVESQLFVGHGVKSGQYKSSVHQKFVRSSQHAIGWGKLSGITDKHSAIVGYWLEGASRRGQATRFKGYQMFKKAAAHLNKLAKQLAGRHFARAVKRLT